MGTLSAKSYAPNKIHSLGYCSLVAALALLLPVLCLATEDSKAIRRDRGGSATAVPEMIRADLYAVVVGVSNYKDPKIPKLRVSDKDALDFAEFLKTQKELYRNIWLTILVNEEATSGEVKKHLFYKLRKAGKNDTVILFFSGHGADDPNIPGEFFFLTYDADPEYLEATAVNLTQMKFMHRLDSKRVVLVADTCHAGGFSIQGQKSLEPALEKFISQFNQSEGKIVLTSSRTDEVSLESPDLGNSVFTHYLIKGLAGEADAARKGYVTLKEAYEYVYEKTKDATNGVQHPQLEGRLVGAFPISLNLSLGADVRFNEPSPERDQLASHRPSGATKPPAEAREPRPSDDLNELLKRAKKNDPKAQNDLGDLYFYGRGVPTDYTEAVKWYRKAADQGYARAQADLGDMYYSGKGVPKNYEQALEWYRRSAAQGYARGQADVGDLYYNGQGLPKDYGEALQWYRKAADQGYARAQQKIGDIYYHGHGVPQDYEKALHWYHKAASQGNARAQCHIGDLYYYGRGVTKDYQQALFWYRRAADQGYARGQSDVGHMYAYGYGVPKDAEKALAWYRKAADRGYMSAQYSLATDYYIRGLTTMRDTLKRGQSFSKTAQEKDPDFLEAFKWFHLAGEQGHEMAQKRLGEMHSEGYGTPKNVSEAKKWFRKAAEQGNAEAKEALRKMGISLK